MSSEAQDEAAPAFHVTCARELFAALESLDSSVRLAALQAVQQSPDIALNFGPYGEAGAERDLIDVLLAQSKHYRNDLEWFSWIGALTAFHDPRIVAYFAMLLETQTHTELLFALANYLREEPVEAISAGLRAALMQNDCVARTRAVASLLAGSGSLATAEALRIGLLHPEVQTPLPVFAKAVEEWLAELEGPFASEAQLELEGQGTYSLPPLAASWSRLSEHSKIWLLLWAAKSDAGSLIVAIREALSGTSPDLLAAALEAAENLKQFPAELEASILPHFDHSDELIRLGAVRASRADVDWQRLFGNESSPLVGGAILGKLIERQRQQAAPFVVQQLAHEDWRIRAAAAEALLSLGAEGIRASFMLLPTENESVRIAISRMVLSADDAALLSEYLRLCPAA